MDLLGSRCHSREPYTQFIGMSLGPLIEEDPGGELPVVDDHTSGGLLTLQGDDLVHDQSGILHEPEVGRGEIRSDEGTEGGGTAQFGRRHRDIRSGTAERGLLGESIGCYPGWQELVDRYDLVDGDVSVYG